MQMQPLTDITDDNISDYIQLPMEPQKSLYYFFSLFSVSVHLKTCKNTLMCKIGGITV